MQQIVAQYQGRRYNAENRNAYLQLVNGLAFGESREQGITRGRNFYHEPLGIAITAPEGWSVQNQADAVALVNPERNAGLVMQMAPAKAGGSPDEIVRNLVEQPRTDRYSIRGLPATHFVGTRRDEQGNTQTLEGTAVAGPGGRNYLFLYAAADANALQRSRGAMQQAEGTFRAMTAADRSAARPWTLRTVAYPRGGFAELARNSPLPHAEQMLRLLNGFYAGGQPQPGQMVKIVE
jgi:predicted Zn-dependent protease